MLRGVDDVEGADDASDDWRLEEDDALEVTININSGAPWTRERNTVAPGHGGLHAALAVAVGQSNELAAQT